ncbi:MAG: hypothetical protein JWM53_4463, partial [bacterium]|nr:hypothetical protein [bacterium]
MNVEDSYEIAVRRLRRLGHAGYDLAPPAAVPPPSDDIADRLRDLEELATLACDDNDRLTRELDGARHEVARLQYLVTTLQETLANVQSDEPFATEKRRGRGAAFYFFIIAILGA